MEAGIAGAEVSRGVLVVDANRLFAELLGRAVDAEPGLHGLGHAQSAGACRRRVELVAPDVVVTDARLGAPDEGVALAGALLQAHPALVVVVLTTSADAELVRRAATAGVAALLPKDGALDELLDALRRVRRGSLSLHSGLLAPRLVPAQGRSCAAEPLTRREQQVLQLLADGADPSTIARQLGISVNTCRGYVKNLRLKLGAHTQLEAVVTATRRGLVRVGPG